MFPPIPCSLAKLHQSVSKALTSEEFLISDCPLKTSINAIFLKIFNKF